MILHTLGVQVTALKHTLQDDVGKLNQSLRSALCILIPTWPLCSRSISSLCSGQIGGSIPNGLPESKAFASSQVYGHSSRHFSQFEDGILCPLHVSAVFP